MQPSLPQVLLATQLLSSTSMHSSPSRSPLWTKPRSQKYLQSSVATEMKRSQGAMEAASSVKLSAVYLTSSQLTGT